MTCDAISFGRDPEQTAWLGKIMSVARQRWELTLALAGFRMFLEDITSSNQFWMPKHSEKKDPKTLTAAILQRRQQNPMRGEITVQPTDVRCIISM